MPRPKTREEWLWTVRRTEAENETLQDQVDSIADIIERRLSNGASSRCGLAEGAHEADLTDTAQAKGRRMSASRKALALVWNACVLGW